MTVYKMQIDKNDDFDAFWAGIDRKYGGIPRFGGLCFVFKDAKLLFAENPKTGCTTVKHLILKHLFGRDAIAEGVHLHDLARELLPLSRDFDRAELFSMIFSEGWERISFVRNPYDRLRSAYQDKIAREKEFRGFADAREEIRNFQAQSLSIPREDPISFETFVRWIDTKGLNELNHHWSEQAHTIWYDQLRFTKLFHTEDLQSSLPWILERLGAPAEFISENIETHLNATERLPIELSTKVTQIIQRKFHRDFELFTNELTILKSSRS